MVLFCCSEKITNCGRRLATTTHDELPFTTKQIVWVGGASLEALELI